MPDRSAQRSELKLGTLFHRLSNVAPDRRPKLAILTENEFLFSYKDKLNWSTFIPGHGPVEGIKPERGDVMDFFAQLELIVNQIFVVHLMQFGGEVEKLEQLLDSIELFSKIRFLADWLLISKKERELLICLKQVRNGFAHNWDIKAVEYKGKPVLDNFTKFKKDAAATFSALIKLYNGKEVDIDELIEKYS